MSTAGTKEMFSERRTGGAASGYHQGNGKTDCGALREQEISKNGIAVSYAVSENMKYYIEIQSLGYLPYYHTIRKIPQAASFYAVFPAAILRARLLILSSLPSMRTSRYHDRTIGKP